MPDHVVIGLPGADQHFDELGAAFPDATLTMVDADRGWVEDGDTTVLLTDQPPVNDANLHRPSWVQLGSHGFRQLSGLALAAEAVVTNASGVQDRPLASG